jgi:cytochrome c-type biogenesis protein CcmH/NrfG
VEPEPVPLPAEEPPAEEEKGILELARTALERDEIDQAVHHYQNALMEKEYLDTIISDLKEATERSPHSPALWQALGDAFMKNNSFSDAIDSYRRGVEAM